ncbi:hypothetical protein GDO86_003358 [Hymenochirus boettgeri]|uniref:C3H1-type domain-containing protein n=1 Tax=Hymenochirus boettgeri TaxID=247094 RepID=A0A8T2K5E3_9PIPI|nr:hypothetical protein GDO86_003358 [Hymenochirus boettgeri]
MSNKGDDCYFYFYSTCTKGDSCPFRHCEAALGNETVCTLWQDQRCFREICRFRHMEIDKKRSEIPCYWENQISGCQKGNCAFHHTKGRFVDGIYLPPSKTNPPVPEVSDAELPSSHLAGTQSKVPVASPPQLRGLKKIEPNENIPSPTHPPVVINAADDDEDDEDQVSEEGDELKYNCQQHASPKAHQGAHIISIRKAAKKNIGSSTAPILPPGSSTKAVAEEKMVVRTVSFCSKNDHPNIRLSMCQRLGRRKEAGEESLMAEFFPPAKKRLSERLGKRMTSGEDTVLQPEEVLIPRPVKERLGFPPEQSSIEAENVINPASEFHIKTLQEIRQEKASKKQGASTIISSTKSQETLDATKFQHSLLIQQAENKCGQLKLWTCESQNNREQEALKVEGYETKIQRNEKQQVEIEKVKNKDKTTNLRSLLSNIQSAKQLKIEKKSNNSTNTEPKRSLSALHPSCVHLKDSKGTSCSIEQVRVKTLEEIRREKALRIQQSIKQEKTQSEEVDSQLQAPSIRKRILRISSSVGSKGSELVKTSAETRLEDIAKVKCVKSSSENKKEEANHRCLSFLKAQLTTTKSTSILEKKYNCDSIPSVQGHENKTKVKVNVDSRDSKKHLPRKITVKRKAQEVNTIAAVRPLSSAEQDLISDMVAIKAMTEEHPIKHSKESELDNSEPHLPNAAHVPARSRRTSTTSAGRSSIATEDDFDQLIWEISEGKLEAEIDLDPSKDEDDLLLELSEMIDS